MAVDIKVAPDEKLELVQTYITDTNLNSDYFNISELPDTFTGGKNAFLIAGSDKLLANTEIKIQIRDAAGNVCYVEYSNGSPEYYEGNSKVAAVYVYPTITSFGPATITILGQLKDVPQEWNGLYSVKWTKQVNINPALANTTRVRFYKRPLVSITEIVEPLYTIVSGSKTASLIQGSFASIKVNQLETFAGDVKRIKVYRTAQGDISDYDLIQDILVESKNLLTTYELSGSVVGDGGLFTNDSLSKLWLTGSLNATLDATYIENGLQLTGSGTLTYSASLNLLSSNTYELQLDSFFTGSTADNLGIYLSYPTQSTLGQAYTSTTTIAILNGLTPTKKFGIQTFPFTIPFDYPTASLYLSQSIGKWHVGNIGLNVSQDTAFSPNEISFVTSMPTVLTNETFNFKFEFYDVNNNYVPVAVTQSAVFVGGTNFNTLQSGSLYTSASLTALSQSVSGTISTTSASLSSSISKSASETSASSANFIILVSGSLSSSINVVSGSQYTLSQSVSSSLASISNSAISQASQSLYQVYSASAFLDKFIFTDENGKLNQPPTASGTGLFLGSNYLGFYSSSATASTSGWKTYMDNQGDFYLTGSNGQFLAWASSLGTLQIQGQINIQEGGITNAATTKSVADVYSSASAYSSSAYTSISASNAAAAAYSASLMSSSLYISASLNSGISGSSYNATLWSASLASSSLFYSGALSARAEAISSSTAFTTNLLDGRIFTDVSGNINKPPNVRVNVSNGLYLGSNYLGFYSGSDWKTYMDNQGKFYLTGSANDHFPNYLVWDGAGGLTVAGTINIVGSNSNIYTQTEINTISSSISASAYRAYLSASSYSGSLATTITTNSGSTATSISASNAASLAYSASISASTAATTALLDGRIFTDANGRVVKAPTASVAGLFLGNTHLGFYDGSGTWKTYMDNQGKFYLTGSSTTPFSNYLVWDGAGGLTIAGAIDITGGNGATQDYAGSTASGSLTTATTRLNTSSSVLQGNLNTSASALQGNITGVDNKVFTSTTGLINKTPSVSTSGLYLGSTFLGYYNGSDWKTYMSNTGNFFLSGAGSDSLSWSSGVLAINGAITATTGYIGTAAAGFAINSSYIGNGKATLTDANAGVYVGTDGIALGGSSTFKVTSAGALTATSATITGAITATSLTLSGFTLASSAVGLGNVSNYSPANQAKYGIESTIDIGSGGIRMNGGGYIKGGQTDYNTGTGFFLGYHDSAYKFSIGNSASNYVTFDGAGTLAVGGTITANAGAIGGWELAATRLKSTDSVTRLDSTNKEFAVMDPNNLNYYKVRIGAGTTFQSQPFHPFTEINQSGFEMGGIISTGGFGLRASIAGYNDTANSNTGVAVSTYSTIDYTINQYTPVYARIFENASGVSSGVAAGEFVGGIIARNTTTPGASDAINQGFAIITDGHNYLGGAGKTTQIANPFFALSDVYLRGLALNPSGAGTNYTIKADTLTNGKLFQSSSSRKTKNIYGNWKIGGVLENIKKVPVKRFKYKNWADDEVETFGLIAEDLHNNDFWQSVIYDADKNNKAIYTEKTVAGIDYEKVTSILWKGMQELLQKVEDLETQLKNK